MEIVINTTPEDIQRAQRWFDGLEIQWKMAYNEAIYGNGPIIKRPDDKNLLLLLVHIDTVRFAGPMSDQPNMTTTLSNLSGLKGLNHLKYISITNHNIESLVPIRYLTKLEHLFVNDNKLKSLDGIEKMHALKDLYCQGNQIDDLSPIKNLTNLETIYACRNTFSQIDGLNENHVKNLKKFYILPNTNLPDREVIRVQNELGILCKTG